MPSSSQTSPLQRLKLRLRLQEQTRRNARRCAGMQLAGYVTRRAYDAPASRRQLALPHSQQQSLLSRQVGLLHSCPFGRWNPIVRGLCRPMGHHRPYCLRRSPAYASDQNRWKTYYPRRRHHASSPALSQRWPSRLRRLRHRPRRQPSHRPQRRPNSRHLQRRVAAREPRLCARRRCPSTCLWARPCATRHARRSRSMPHAREAC